MSPNLSFASSWDPKVACVVTLALVFLCGAAAGAVAMNLGGTAACISPPSIRRRERPPISPASRRNWT